MFTPARNKNKNRRNGYLAADNLFCNRKTDLPGTDHFGNKEKTAFPSWDGNAVYSLQTVELLLHYTLPKLPANNTGYPNIVNKMLNMLGRSRSNSGNNISNNKIHQCADGTECLGRNP